MYFLFLVLYAVDVLACLVPVAPAAVRARDDIAPFNITGFSAAVDPNAINGYLQFWVSMSVQVSKGEPFAPCYAWAPSPNRTLGSIDYAFCNSSSNIAFAWLRAEGGFRFDIHYNVSSDTEEFGTHWVPDTEIVWALVSDITVQAYNGPTSFTIDDIKNVWL